MRTRNFTRAAEACHVTQPTLSHQIRKLEEELGEPLLLRRRDGAVPTESGGRFFPRAVRILEESEAALREAAEHRDIVQGTLRVGVIPTVAPYVLPGLLRLAKGEYPRLRFEVLEGPTAELLARLRVGSLDAAVLSPPVEGGDLSERALFDDEFLLAVPRGASVGEGREGGRIAADCGRGVCDAERCALLAGTDDEFVSAVGVFAGGCVGERAAGYGGGDGGGGAGDFGGAGDGAGRVCAPGGDATGVWRGANGSWDQRGVAAECGGDADSAGFFGVVRDAGGVRSFSRDEATTFGATHAEARRLDSFEMMM